jgi:hypothetical protein
VLFSLPRIFDPTFYENPYFPWQTYTIWCQIGQAASILHSYAKSQVQTHDLGLDIALPLLPCQQLCYNNQIKRWKERAGSMAQWKITHLVCINPWVQPLALEKKIKKKKFS